MRYKGVSISGVNEGEFLKLLHSRGVIGDPNDEKSPTLADVLDPHIKQGGIQSLVFLAVFIPAMIVLLCLVFKFGLLPLLIALY